MKNVGYILIVCLILKLWEWDFDMTPQMLKDGATSNITLSGDAQFGFFFTDLKQSWDSSGNTNFDDLTKSYNVTQFITTQVGVPTTYNFIPNPSYDIQSSILNQMQQYSTMIPTTDSIYTEGRMYMTKKILLSSIPHTWLYALRLTNPNTNSFGYATILNKQKILYGFETNFSLNIAHANLKWNKYAWMNDIAEGFALIFQDANVDLSTLTLDKDNGLGFSGLTNSVAVKFDFHIDLNSTFPYLTHPGQPYVSVHVSNPLTSDYSSVIGFAWLPYSLTKGGQHHVTINYTRAIEDEPYLGDLSFTTYGGSLLDYTDPSSWFSKFKLGLLKIYIDDMDRSVLQVPINLGSSVQTDDLTGINPNTLLIKTSITIFKNFRMRKWHSLQQ